MYKSSKKEAQHDEKPRITTLFLVLQLQHDETRLWKTVQARDKRVKKTRIEVRTSQNTLSCGRSEGLTRRRTGSLRGKKVTKREGSKNLDGICLAGHKKIHDWSEPREGLSDNGKGAPLFLPNPPLGSSFFFFFCACLVIRPFSLIRSLVPSYPLKFPLCTSAIFTFRSSTVETRKRLFSYRHNQSPQLQENYRL